MRSGAFAHSHAAWTDHTWGDRHVASDASGAGHRNAMDGCGDCGDARTPALGSEPLVDDHRGVCNPGARCARGGRARLHQDMGSAPETCL